MFDPAYDVDPLILNMHLAFCVGFARSALSRGSLQVPHCSIFHSIRTMSTASPPRRVTRASARASARASTTSPIDDDKTVKTTERMTRKRAQLANDATDDNDDKVSSPPKKKVTRATKSETSIIDDSATETKKTKRTRARTKRGGGRKKVELTPEEEAEKAKWYAETKCDQPWGVADDAHLKIVTWNINGAKSMVNSGHLLDYIEREEPDILFIQETKYTSETVEGFIELPDYDIHWNHCTAKKGYSGVALLVSKERLARKNVSVISVEPGMGQDEADAEGRVLTAVLSNGLALVNCYVPNAGQKLPRLPYRVDVFEPAMRKFLSGLREKHRRVIYCGDLNVAHDECDIHNSKANQKNSGHTPEERAAFGEMLKEGWVDTMRHMYPYKRCYTYFSLRFGDRMRKENKGWRIDYFITTPFERDEIVDVFTRYDQEGSDHKPVALVVKA